MSILVTFSYAAFAIFASFVVFLLLFYHWRWPSHRKLCHMLPAPKMLSIFGIGLKLIVLKESELMDFIHSLWKNHGSFFYAEYLGAPNIFVVEPQDVEVILSGSQYITKGFEYRNLAPWLCEGLLTSSGSKWHMRRKMLTPTFHFKILDNFIPVFNRNAKLLTEKFSAADGLDVDVDAYVSLCTLDIICETAMGTKLDSQMGNAAEYVGAIKKAGQIILKKCVTFWMMNELVFNLSPVGKEFRKNIKLLHNFTEKVIKERKKNYHPNTTQEETEIGKQKQRKSFLDCLIEMQRENPNEMTDLGIREEVDTFMFEGHDTTSVAITWALFMIASHEDVQIRLQEELQQVFGDDTERDATYQDLSQLSYLDMVIKESLRLYPSVPYMSRLLTTDVKIKGYVVPSNTNAVIVPYLVHRNPDIFPEPEKFIPERFLPEVAKERHPFAYIPFSAGFRNCIGQKFANLEEKVVISTILRKLKLSTDMKKEELKVLPQVILRPDKKIKIKFSPV